MIDIERIESDLNAAVFAGALKSHRTGTTYGEYSFQYNGGDTDDVKMTVLANLHLPRFKVTVGQVEGLHGHVNIHTDLVKWNLALKEAAGWIVEAIEREGQVGQRVKVVGYLHFEDDNPTEDDATDGY